MSSDAAQCAAFFEISATCAANTDAMATAADLLEHRKVMEKIAFLMGKASGMSVEGVQARFATVSDAELESISRSCVNFSVLLHRYGRACRDFEAHPEQRMTDLRSHGLGTAWPNGLPD
ncbi:hypothetical protein FHR90_003464 [Endobacter medicaginis]|uniref:Uncharacterized protein n=1 Tax=Endobacter medicaginis TaxID=1181271 RepID=A0A850NWG3_9PROT|nr:hypothetical protein [Endobacter medicaginis]MBB3175602.1 hypothetical protein [Endobacter medicaginis]NVN31802.1 hypothetical protein [Endobacter medicaginis]